HMRERMAADLLNHGARPDLLHEGATVEVRVGLFVTAGIVLEPIPCAPEVFGANDFGVGRPGFGRTAIEEEMTRDAPGRRNVKFGEQVEQSQNDLSLELAGRTEAIRSEQVKGPPDQLKVQANDKNTTVRLPGVSVFHHISRLDR